MTERSGSASDFLAAERTFLAWIRTGLALMGFELSSRALVYSSKACIVANPICPFWQTDISPWIGTTLIAMGIVVNLWCAAGHIRLVRQLKRGESDFEPPSAVVITVALVLAILGLAMRSISCESANQTLFARKNQ